MESLSEEAWNETPPCAWATPNTTILLAGSYPNETYLEAKAHNGKDFYLAVKGEEGTRKVSQTISEIKDSEYYTISGYVSSLLNLPDTQELTISFNENVEIPLWS
jgi:hypothetical protein